MDQSTHIVKQQWPGIEVRLQSYEIFQRSSHFDGIVSVGAFEHFVRPGYSMEDKCAIYHSFFNLCREWPRPAGVLSLQTICQGRSSALLPLDIFPDSDLPYPSEVLEAANHAFELMYSENGREDYILTLGEWLMDLRRHRSTIVENYGGEEFYAFYDRYLRRAIAGFARKRMTLNRFIFVRR
jgi:cyclopropane-fatty-acyl-phospholipid synthase